MTVPAKTSGCGVPHQFVLQVGAIRAGRDPFQPWLSKLALRKDDVGDARGVLDRWKK
jgi:hypothetical protein